MRISVFSNGQNWPVLILIATLGFSTNFFFLPLRKVSAGGRPSSCSNLVIDHATFMSHKATENILEVSCQFSNRDLQFFKQGDRFLARFVLSVFLFDLSGNKVAERSYQDSVSVDSYDETNSHTETHVLQFCLSIPPGTYHEIVELADDNLRRTCGVESDIEVRKFVPDRLQLSDIQFAHEVTPGEEKRNFVKNGRQVLPNPSRQYGLLNPKVGIYFEIYHLQYEPENRFNSFSVVYTLNNKNNDIIDVLSQTYQKPGASAVVSLTIPAEKLPTDTYSLSIEVFEEDTREKSCLSGQFSVWQSPISLKFKDYNQAVEELSYIASPEEIRHLKSLSSEKHQQALLDFWRARDPSSGTEENELMNEYYLRLKYANQVFKTGKQQGWKTDRGRIYVRYGQPDCIIHNPYQIPSKPYEIWEYEQQNLKFIFVDETGFGEYRLLTPHSYSQFLLWY